MARSYAGVAEGPKNSSRAGSLWWEVLLAIIVVPLLLGVIAGTSLLLGQASVNIPPEVLDIDIQLYRAAVALRDPQLTGVVFTLFNDPGVDYTVLIAACLGYVWWKRRRDMVGAVAAVGLTLVVGAWTIPYTHQFGLRPRPFQVIPDVVIDPTWREIWTYNPTFPSGHVRELAGLGVVLSYFWPRARWFALPYVGFIAFSRVYIGAHFPTDVLAGLFIGVLAGAFSVVSVERGSKIVFSLAQAGAVKRAYSYLFGPPASEQRAYSRMLAIGISSGLALGLLLAVGFGIGALVYVTSPRILADYLRNTDNSLVYPIFSRFDASLGQVLYGIFADASKSYPALAIFILGFGALRGKRSLGYGAILAVLAFLVAQAAIILVSPHFARPRPFSTGEVALPYIWQNLWPGPASLPDPYLVTLMALSTVLAHIRRALLIPAYLYSLLAGVAMLYFGAAWPTDVVATLVIGHLAARYAIFLVHQILPAKWRGGNG
ncbi:MAG: phosphatase PAP2 family protein [Chloroflexi bacterium]|nr:phosphatase PAP2 family protein [Chloroflexota bacterium]